jgi:hypothetical protein
MTTSSDKMAVDARPARLAVLIDADNASAKIVDGLFEEIATFNSPILPRTLIRELTGSRS